MCRVSPTCWQRHCAVWLSLPQCSVDSFISMFYKSSKENHNLHLRFFFTSEAAVLLSYHTVSLQSVCVSVSVWEGLFVQDWRFRIYKLLWQHCSYLKISQLHSITTFYCCIISSQTFCYLWFSVEFGVFANNVEPSFGFFLRDPCWGVRSDYRNNVKLGNYVSPWIFI